MDWKNPPGPICSQHGVCDSITKKLFYSKLGQITWPAIAIHQRLADLTITNVNVNNLTFNSNMGEWHDSRLNSSLELLEFKASTLWLDSDSA